MKQQPKQRSLYSYYKPKSHKKNLIQLREQDFGKVTVAFCGGKGFFDIKKK